MSTRDNASAQTDGGRAAHLLEHLGERVAAKLTERDLNEYRTRRFGEISRRGKTPSPATLDREVELLKRTLNYGVRCGSLETNPIARARLLRKPNVRREVLSEESFERLLQACDDVLKPIVLMAFDTGMRKEEILDLRWSQVNLKEGVVRLAPQDTKTKEGRPIYLRDRLVQALRALPRQLHGDHVFVNPETGERWQEIRRMWARATKAAGLEGTWFHDLRRSFVTNARRVHAIPESVIMRMSGHKTRAVFDRYNIVCEDDVRSAVASMDAKLTERSGQDLDKVVDGAPETPKALPAKFR